MEVIMLISIIGGTGRIGEGLALNLVNTGYPVIIGSRSEEKAITSSKKIRKIISKNVSINGMKNIDAAQAGELVIISIPNMGRKLILSEIKPFLYGKIVFDVTLPIVFNPLKYIPPKEGSNAMETKIICGRGIKVVSGMHTVSSKLLCDASKVDRDFDVLIAGDDANSKKILIEIFNNLGIRAFDSGELSKAEILEKLAFMLIEMNQRYKRKSIGIKLYGI
jgi:NADPH-dependent F420 reductase